MAEPQGQSAPRVYALLADRPNLAVERALLEALPELEPELQPVALDLLIDRGRDQGLTGLVAEFDQFDPNLQELILSRVHGLYSAARVGIADDRLEVRRNAVELIRRSGDPKLAYLLAEGLCQPCPKTRAAAGQALHDATADYLERRANARRNGNDLARLDQEGDYLARALHRAIDAWDLHFRLEVLTAAMWMADRLEDALFDKAASPRSSFARALVERLINPDDARLAGFAWRALRSPELRSQVAKQIAACRHPNFVGGLIAESWLLVDPAIARECPRIRRWAWLEAGEEALLSLPPDQAAGALRLIVASGLALEAKVAWYARLIAGGSQPVQRAAFWRLAAAQTEPAASLLRRLAQRGDGPIAVLAKRELRRQAHAYGHDPTVDGVTTNTPHPFDAFWRTFDELDADARRAGGAELVRTCPDLLVRLRGKLASGQAAERARALTIARTLGLTKPLEEQVYRLTSDPDPTARSQAVAMLADLDGPITRRIVRRSLDDPDARVQANAIEVLDRLPVPTKHEQLAPKLESSHQRVRANAVAALLKMQTGQAAEALLDMLSDSSGDHRISALWVVERLGLASMLHRLEEMAETDPDARVRRRARRVLRTMPVWSRPIGVAAGAEDQLL